MICSAARTIIITPRNRPFFPVSVSTKIHVKPPLIFKRKSSSSFSMAIEPSSSSSSSSSSTSLILTSGASGRINALFSVRALKSLLMLINAVVLLLLLPFRGRRRTVPAEKAINNNSNNNNNKDFEDCGGALRKGSTKVRVPTTIVPWKSSASSVGGGGGGSSVVVVDQEVAARRALAIRRVTQDDDPNCDRDFSLFVTARGDTIFTQLWAPVSVNISYLFGIFLTFILSLWLSYICAFLVLGHGGSDGLHSYVHALDYAVNDLKSFLDKVLGENPGLPCFCFGHSTGGAIVLKAMLDPKVEARVAGVVLTSPAVGVQPSHPIFVVLAPIFSFLLPRFQLSAANKKGLPVSRDPEALVAKYSDPLVYTGAIRIRTGYEILRITTYLQRNLSRLRVPFLVLHGTADTVTDPEASQKLYDEASSTDKTIKLLEGFLHDLLFELERDDIVNEIIEWLSRRV
ncbi:Monoglyceride lipase, putative [Ricinus communis]|uniref:Monoglyceride lipase, putative n=1 Tax=Ricinus communis TaxID=3988 RepID=B9T6B0_RICCO|nr:Monoglyceride lipase, putative [Ricinus communis]